jgi:PKHD-type hydroxylase
VLTCIEQLVDAATLNVVREQLAERSLFRSGAVTAAGQARRVKRNLQAISGERQIKGVSGLLERVILEHPVFRAAARPRRLARLLLSRYETGMYYGSHIDAPQIDGVRTDVSFTLFLSPPESYTGGELVLESGAGEEAIKLEAGALVCYPSTFRHRVEPVRAGVRLVAVGWVQSEIRSAEHRSLLFTLDSVMARLAERPGDTAAIGDLANIRANLQRMWLDA